MKTTTLEKFLKGKRLYDEFKRLRASYDHEISLEDYINLKGESPDAITSAFFWLSDSGTDWHKVHIQWFKFLTKHRS